MIDNFREHYCRKISYKIFVLLIGLCFQINLTTASANCWTSDLSEEEQLAVARETYADGLYSASIETTKCYLDQFKESFATEEIHYLRVKALRKAGDIKGSIKAFDQLKKNFPGSISYLDDELLQRAIILIKKRQYPLANESLNTLLKDYPISSLREETYYWLGYVSSISAELVRKKNKKLALQKYEQSIKYFNNSDPKSLNRAQQSERFYLKGRAWWFLDQISKTEKAWQNYLLRSNSQNTEKELNIKFQLASKFQSEEKYEKAENWFARIVNDHPDSELAIESSFWRAEMAYAAAIRRTNTIDLAKKSVNRLVNNYNMYIAKNDQTHLPLTYYRIGVLEQKNNPKRTIIAFQKYLATKDKLYASEVQYGLAYLYIENKEFKNAISAFKKYLGSEDKTFTEDALYRLAYLYIETKNPKKAIETFKTYLKSGKGKYTGEIQIRLGYLYKQIKKPKEAIRVFNQYLSSKNKDYLVEAQIRLGYLYLETKQQKKAIKIFEKYLSGKDTKHIAEIQIRLGYLYIETKQPKKATKIFEKYLASDDEIHAASVKIRLAYLYVETKQNFLAISLLEQVRKLPDYKQNLEVLQTLMELYRDTVSKAKFVQFLLSALNDIKLDAQLRHGFQTQLLLAYFEQNKCREFLLEIKEKPGYLEKSKRTNKEEWQHLQYLKINCLFETEKWEESRIASRRIIDIKKYREQAIQILLESHKKLKDWESITWEFQEIYEREPSLITIPYFQLWLFAAQNRTDFQRLERIQIIAERWKRSFPEDTQNMEQLNLLITSERLQELSAQENWAGVSNFIRSEHRTGNISLDQNFFSQLIYAEQNLKNWEGILSAYTLLGIDDPQRSDTLEALVSQARAAEKLNKKDLSKSFFRKALKVKPQSEKDKKTQDEIRKFLAQGDFQQWIEDEQWSKITNVIYKEVRAKKRILDVENFDLLLFAENKKVGSVRYNGILDAYALMAKYNKAKTLTVKSLIDQGYAAEKLGGYKRAKGYYRNALKKVSDKNITLVLQLVGELTSLYERSNDYKSLVHTYRRAYSVLKKSSRPKKEYQTYAYLIGYHLSSHLKQPDKARTWMIRADGGGNSNQELLASFWVAQLDRQGNKSDKALKRLIELAGRKIQVNSLMYIQIHFELGTLYHYKEDWESSLRHYRIVAKANAPKELEQFQNTAKQKAKEIYNYLKSIEVSE